MSAPDVELERPIKVRSLPNEPFAVEASETERTALARRFGVSEISALSAEARFRDTGDGILTEGRLAAEIVQPCAVTREDFAYRVDEPFALLFVPAGQLTEYAEDEEVELDDDAPDEVEYYGDSFDFGEALAQTLGLSIDPYREGPDADAARAENDIRSDDEPVASGPLAEALAGLQNKPD